MPTTRVLRRHPRVRDRWAPHVVALVTALAAVAGTSPAVASVQPQGAPTPAHNAIADQYSPGAPIVFVFDTSSSMSESGDDGVVRLDGAKAAAIEVIYGMSADTKVGVWAYPDDGDCSAGRSLLDVSNLDISRVTAEIRALQPSGNTPTSVALRAVTDSLKTQGFSSGTIVLATDGEANCNQDPCEVARQIVAEGFDLTVNPTGINISDVGREQLECIAGATGGKYYDANNAADLMESLLDGSRAALTLETTGTSGTARAGSRLTVTATVTNTSLSVAAQNVSLSLTFRTEGGALGLTALPPTFRVGNLPPGASLTRSWRVSTAGAGVARPRILAQATNSLPTQVDGSLTLSATPATLAEAGPLLSDAKRVAILGDSYSSGEGSGIGPDAGTYLNVGAKDYPCHRSLNTYGLGLYGVRDGEAVVACSGAVSGDFWASNTDRDRDSQSSDLHRLLKDSSRRPDLVLVTFGGNDIGFSNIVGTCGRPADCTNNTVTRIPTPDEEAACVEQRTMWVAGVPPACRHEELWTAAKLRDAASLDLTRMYVALAKTVGDATPKGAPPVPIVVLPYPQVITNTSGLGCPHLNLEERKFGVDVLQTLNHSVEQSVRKAQGEGALIYFARDVTEAMLPGHTACADDPPQRFVNAISFPEALTSDQRSQLMHPNTPGYRAVTDALVDWSVLPDVTSTWAADAKRTQPRTVWTMPSTWGPSTDIDLLQGSTIDPTTVSAGTELTVRASGFAPNSDVRIVVRSTPTALGVRTAGADGIVTGTVTVPPTLTPGDHHLTVEGLAPSGAPTLVSAPLRVRPPTPFWLAIVGAISLILLASAAALSVATKRRRRANS